MIERISETYNYDDVFKVSKTTDYYLAFTEISEILKQLGKKYIDKIPQEVLNVIEQNKYENSNFKFYISKKIGEQKIHKETLEILAYLNYNFWLDNVEKSKFEKILQRNSYEIDCIKREKYNPEDIFKKKKKNVQELQIQVVKESFGKKIIKKIGELIKKWI